MIQERYSLNLSPRYAPNWGAWEVAREIICNAIDASPESMQVLLEGPDTLRVITKSVPNLSELFIIGEGSKAPGGQTIGQFGEGLKIAALVASRSTGGGITLALPGKTITFGFEDVMGAPVLHAFMEPNPIHSDGYEATIRMTGIALAFAGRLLSDRTEGPLNQALPGEMRVYSKGVYITFKKCESIWDWNLNSLRVNRDRSMVSELDLVLAIGNYLRANITSDQAEQMIRCDDSFESNTVLYWVSGGLLPQSLRDAFYRVHGNKACIASENAVANIKVKSNGYEPVTVNKHLAKVLDEGGVPTASSLIPRDYDLEPVPSDQYQAQIARLKSLDKLISAPGCSVCVFATRNDALKGRASTDDCRIWLSEQLFSPGNEQELVRTYLHEMGHIMSSAGDATVEFEHVLDGIAGRLAMHILSPALREEV